MINISRLIQNANALLAELENGAHELISRSTPTTWGELRDFFQTELVPILIKLFEEVGGLAVIPHIDLPDGVTSTSLVSQSEMTQFVTNTLNVWQGMLEDRLKDVSNISIDRFKPDITLHVKRSLTALPPVEVPVIEITKPVISLTKPIPALYTFAVNVPTFSITKPTVTLSRYTD